MKFPYLPAYIIEKLRELRRQQKPEVDRRPVLRVPPPQPPPPVEKDINEDEPSARGPIIIDMNTYDIDINEEL